MAVKIYDSSTGAFKDAPTPQIYDASSQAYRDSTGLVYDTSKGAWDERWGNATVLYYAGKSPYLFGEGYSNKAENGATFADKMVSPVLSAVCGSPAYPTFPYENALLIVGIDFSYIKSIHINGEKHGVFYVDYTENPTKVASSDIGIQYYIGRYSPKQRITVQIDNIDMDIDTTNWNCKDGALAFTNYGSYNDHYSYSISKVTAV